MCLWVEICVVVIANIGQKTGFYASTRKLTRWNRICTGEHGASLYFCYECRMKTFQPFLRLTFWTRHCWQIYVQGAAGVLYMLYCRYRATNKLSYKLLFSIIIYMYKIGLNRMGAKSWHIIFLSVSTFLSYFSRYCKEDIVR